MNSPFLSNSPVRVPVLFVLSSQICCQAHGRSLLILTLILLELSNCVSTTASGNHFRALEAKMAFPKSYLKSILSVLITFVFTDRHALLPLQNLLQVFNYDN